MLQRTEHSIYILLLACLWLTSCGLPVMTPPPSQPDDKGDVGAAGLGDPLYPGLGNGGYDVTHYAITLAVEMAGNTISGTTTIQAQATQPLASFNLSWRKKTGFNNWPLKIGEGLFLRQPASCKPKRPLPMKYSCQVSEP